MFCTTVMGKYKSMFLVLLLLSYLLPKTVYVSIAFISHRANSMLEQELRGITTIVLKLTFADRFSVDSFFHFEGQKPNYYVK